MNIKNIAPLLASRFVDVDVSKEEFIKYTNFLLDNKSLIGPFFDLIGKLHDSWIFKTAISPNNFNLELNDFTTHVFADALIESKSLSVKGNTLVFPIKITFEINSCTFYNADDDGNLILIEPPVLDEYIDEQIISITNDFIKIGVVVWGKNQNGLGSQTLILIDTQKIMIEDLKDAAWQNIFGVNFNDYYSYFKSRLEMGEFLSDQTRCATLIKEFDLSNSKI